MTNICPHCGHNHFLKQSQYRFAIVLISCKGKKSNSHIPILSLFLQNNFGAWMLVLVP